MKFDLQELLSKLFLSMLPTFNLQILKLVINFFCDQIIKLNQQHNKMEDIFDVVFVQGVDYEAQDGQQEAYFQKTIKDSFSLLSWLISDYQIRILDEITLDQDSKIQIFSQVQSQRLYSLHQRRYGDTFFYALGITGMEGNVDNFRHSVFDDHPEQSIKVIFKSEDEGHTFIIRMVCQKKVKSGLSFRDVFINKDGQIASSLTGGFNYFKPPCIKLTDDDGDYTDIQYYYLEPQSRRFFEPKGYHLSIALQGGGVKGVSYVGVYKALRDLQRRIQKESLGNIPLPITSVIGSSAGAILSLAISAGITEDDSMDVCYMMDNFVEDRLFPTAEETNEDENDLQVKISDTYEDHIEAHYFKNQGDAVKNMLHNFGFMQDSLTDIIFDTLKQPSVQGKLVDLLRAVNPTIASLLTFDQTQKLSEGETIKNCCGSCCCCCYSNCLSCCGFYPCCKSIPGSSCFVENAQNLKRINIKGLLYAGLMSGTALEDVLVYALSRLFGIKAQQQMRNSQTDKNYPKKLMKLAARKRWFDLKNYDGVLKIIADESRKLLESYKNKVNDKDFNYLKNPLMPYAKQLTLEQYYQITGVQFTVTSVDLHDKIERFFNHKTTPNLPVCKSIQMSGSFPIAFLSLSWKKQWGKYYIHYEKSRREIDLTGHKFTDGGLLANFPLKFLDNEKFRQKYFSHENVPGKTLLYGFGLDKLNEFPEKDRSEQVSEKMSILVDEIKYRIMYKLMFYLVESGSKATKQIKNSKVIEYLLSLHDALKQSDRNLNKECFNNEIIKTVFKREVIAHRSKYNYIQEQAEKILREFKACFETHFAKQYETLLREQFDAIYGRYSEYEDAVRLGKNVKQAFNQRLTWKQIEYIQLRIQDNLLIFSPECIAIYQSRLIELKQLYSNANPFVTSATPHHQLQILRLLYDIKKPLTTDISRAPHILATIKNNFIDFLAEFKEICRFQVENIKSTNEDSKLQSKMYIDHIRIRNLITLMYKLSPFTFKAFKKLSKPLMQNIPIISFYIEEQSIIKKDFIRYKLKKLLNQNKIRIDHERKLTGNKIPTQLHIIFQSHYFAHYFYPNYMKIVQEVIANKDLNINIISCTNYHAIYGVLYVMGLDTGTIKLKLSQIQSLFQENFRLHKDYDSKQWLKSSLVQARNLMSREWKRQRDPFEQIQLEYLRQDQSYERLEQSNFNNVQHKHSAAGQQMNDTFEKILNYISGSMDDLYHLNPEKRKNRFKQLLGIGEYRKINEKRSQNGQRIMENFLYYTIDFFMIAAQYTLKNQQYIFASSNKWDRETIFRGVILDSLISAFMYKVYIFDLLSEAGFDENITLSKFYEACSHKILLNFNCVNTTQQRFSVLNRLTHPNMPLWAALMASASLPYLHGEFASRKEWQLKENPDQNLEKADQVFENLEVEGTNRGNNYISGNFISRLPLEFMTNRRLINSKLAVQPNTPIIQIVFSFETTFQTHAQPQYQNLTVSQLNYNKKMDQKSLTASLKFQKMLKSKSMLQIFATQMQGKRKFINCWDMICYLCEFLCCCCCNAEVGSYFGDLLSRLNVLKMLGLRFSSHDNLILHLYYDILIKVPLRIDTLEFYKVTRAMPDFPEAVRQSREVVRELCDTIQVSPSNPAEIYFTTPKDTSIEFYLLQSPIYNNNEWFYRMKFISYTKWRNYKYKYAIEFSEDIAGINDNKFKWRVIQQDYVDVLRRSLEENDYKVMIKYTFYQNKLISNIYMLDLKSLTNLQRYPAAGMITFNNREIGCSQVKIQLSDKDHTPIGRILVKSTNINKSSKYCSNPLCTAKKLVYVLMEERIDPCFECEKLQTLYEEDFKSYKQIDEENPEHKYKKKHITAMKCLQCKASYCIKCKISLFIVRQKRRVGDKNVYELVCPKNPHDKRERYQLKFAPIREKCLGEGQIVKNNCHYCEKYSFDLWHEEGIVLGKKPRKEFGGLRICETCSLYISE